MISFIFFVYIIISLYISLNNLRERYSIFGDLIKRQKPKEAFIEGFLTIPLFVGLGLVIAGLLYVGVWILVGLSYCGLWIYNNMP